MTTALGHGLEDRQRHLLGWQEPSVGRRTVTLPAASSAFSVSRASGSCRDFDIFLSPFLESVAKNKGSAETKPSPESRVCRCDANQHLGL